MNTTKMKSYGTLALAALLTFAVAQPVLAADVVKSSMYGMNIRKTQISGYTLTYYLLDVSEKQATSVMPSETTSSDFNRSKSHHLMVFVTRPDGRPAMEGKAGFRVVTPKKTESREMAVSMDGGFGSDVDFPGNGDFNITTKIVLVDVDLLDEFVYKIK